MTLVQERVRAAIKKHGGLRAAARQLDIHPSLLSLLNAGKRASAGKRTLEKLGLRKQIIHRHEQIPTPPAP